MTNQHPITPPPELVEQWHDAWIDAKVKHDGLIDFLAAQAAQWGAEQELEACLGHLIRCGFSDADILRLRTTRRPQSLSLKEQALEAQRRMWSGASNHDDWDLVRRALEQLPD